MEINKNDNVFPESAPEGANAEEIKEVSPLSAEAPDVSQTATDVEAIPSAPVAAAQPVANAPQYVYYWNASMDMQNKSAKKKKKSSGVLTFAIVMTVAFVIALGVLTAVLVFMPEGPTYNASYGELYDYCTPFTVAIETPNGAIGSGFFVSEDGYIVTNHHVIEGCAKVSVYATDGNVYSAEVAASDPRLDIAVIKITNASLDTVFPCAVMGDSDTVYPGDSVIAIGTPEELSLAWTMTVGYVSSTERTFSSTDSSQVFIQFDAAVNPGNSGGPLINMNGEVIGVVQSKASDKLPVYDASGKFIGHVEVGADDVGFAIPVNIVKSTIDKMISEHASGITPPVADTPTPQLGIMGLQIFSGYEYIETPDRAAYFVQYDSAMKKYVEIDETAVYLDDPSLASAKLFMADKDGLWVISTTEGTPAVGTLYAGDIIVSIDGVDITLQNAYTMAYSNSLFDLVSTILSRHKAGDTVKVELYRDGKQISVDLLLSERT